MTEAHFDPVAWWSRVDHARVAIIDVARDRRVSYGELHADADRWAARLRHHGVRPGDRVGVLARNRYEFLPLLFACIRTRAVLVPLNWRLAPPELARVLAHAQPTCLFGEGEFAVSVRGLPRASMGEWIDLDTEGNGALEDDRDHDASPFEATPALAMLLYTSGSTGAPKGVEITTRQLFWNAVSTCTGWGLGHWDVGIAPTPFFHTVAWHVFTTPLLHAGGSVVLAPSFEPEAFLATLARHAVTMAFCVPSQLDSLLRASSWGTPLPALRTFITGGAPCAPRVAQAVRAAGYRLREAYGLTECGPNCFVTTDHTAVAKDGSVGWPLPFVEMRLVNEHDQPVATGQVGELQLRGPQRCTGYWADPAQTAASLAPGGWFRTGDLAVVDADGVYRICGRRKDMYISGGENVFPGEVEAALRDCRGVHDAVVVGVPDAHWGEVGFALVARYDTTLSEAELLTALRARIAGYKLPRHVHFTDQLPRLGSGKTDRQAVRQEALRLLGAGGTEEAAGVRQAP